MSPIIAAPTKKEPLTALQRRALTLLEEPDAYAWVGRLSTVRDYNKAGYYQLVQPASRELWGRAGFVITWPHIGSVVRSLIARGLLEHKGREMLTLGMCTSEGDRYEITAAGRATLRSRA